LKIHGNRVLGVFGGFSVLFLPNQSNLELKIENEKAKKEWLEQI
jgi:hypothetical protein